MVKFGTLKDYAEAKRIITKAGIKFTETKSPSDLIRRVFVNNIKVLEIARLGGTSWSFLYNPKFWAKK